MSTLLKFPCDYPLKVFGESAVRLRATVIEVLNLQQVQYDETAIKIRLSRNGRFAALTVTFVAQSKPQLDAIYQRLVDSHHVTMAL